MRTPHVAGGIFLVCGTSIGTGILGIPTSTAEAGFLYSTAVFFVCWIFTTIAALYLIEANLWLKEGASLSSMSEQLLGPVGKFATWILNLSLLYALISLYLLAGSSWLCLFINQSCNVSISQYEGMFAILALSAGIVCLGMTLIDNLNRWLTMVFLAAFCVVISKTMHNVALNQIGPRVLQKTLPAVPVLITSFGYSVILPAMGSHFKYDSKKLVMTILVGSIITLLAYVLWEFVTIGNIPLNGKGGLIELATQHDDGTGVIRGLSHMAVGSITSYVNVFTVGIISTSLLGVSLALYHFIKDGFNLNESLLHKLCNLILIFVPPTLLLIFFPTGFHQILSCAGVIVALYLGIIPVLMVWNGRYNLNRDGFRVPGGKTLLVVTFAFYAYIVIQKIFLS